MNLNPRDVHTKMATSLSLIDGVLHVFPTLLREQITS